VRSVIFTLCVSALLRAGTGQELLTQLGNTPLDANECYRIRDVHLVRDEAQFFFSDGYLIFAKPTGLAPAAAFFSGDVEGGDAELLLLPPLRNERRMLSAHTGTPNLEEHFAQAGLVFSPDVYRDLMAEIKGNAFNKKSPEMGTLLVDRWSPLMKNLGSIFGLRLATDILSPVPARKGFLAATLSGAKLGAFNVIFDPRIPEQLLVGSTLDTGFDVWSSFTSQSFRGRAFAPEFTVHDFRIQTRMDADLMLHCTTQITVRPTLGEGTLPFEMSENMRVTGATVNGQPAEVLLRHREEGSALAGVNEVFLLIPAKPLRAGEPAEVQIQHEGKVIQDAGNHVFSVGSRGSWYPNRGRQFARFDLKFQLPKDLDLVAAGDVIEDRVEGPNRISHWKTAVPIRLAGFNLGVYDRTRISQGGLTIEVCANRFAEAGLTPRLPPLPVESPATYPSRAGRRAIIEIPQPPAALAAQAPKIRLQALAKEIGDAMDFYTAHFGPLQLNRLEVSPVPGRFGQGFPGMIYLSTLSYLEPGERAVTNLAGPQKLFFTDILHAHEAAHQWWGNIVTAAEYHDDWLMEALANYSALLYLEKRRGKPAMDAVLEDYRLQLLAKGENGETLESVGPVVQGTRLEKAWIPVVYGKGTWILHMLRRQLGDDAFFRMLRALRNEWEDKALGTEDFRIFCARFLPPGSADPKLESFFDQWVYGTGMPALKLTSTVKGGPGKWHVTGTLTQSETGEEFAAEVPVEIQLGKLRSATRAITRTIIAGAEPTAFDLVFPTQPTKVSIDFRSILHR
jgi:hypothetical protein